MTVAAGTLVSYDRRSDTLERYTVWEKVVTFALLDTETTGLATIPINGLLQKIIIKNGDLGTADGTLDVSLTDNGDNTIWSVTDISQSLTYSYSVSEPLAREVNIVLGFSDPGETVVVTVTLRGV